MGVWEEADKLFEEDESPKEKTTLRESYQVLNDFSTFEFSPKEAKKSLKRVAGVALGALSAPSAAYFGLITPYDDAKDEAEFHEQSLKDQAILRIGSSMQSAYDSIFKEGSFGKQPSEYYKSVTGKEAPTAYEIATAMADPSVGMSLGSVGILKGAGKLSKKAAKAAKIGVKIDDIVKDVPFQKAKEAESAAMSKEAEDIFQKELGPKGSTVDEFEGFLDNVDKNLDETVGLPDESILTPSKKTLVKRNGEMVLDEGVTTIPPKGVNVVDELVTGAGKVKKGIPEPEGVGLGKSEEWNLGKAKEEPKVGGESIPIDDTGKVAKAASDANQQFAEEGMKELPEEELAKYTPTTFEELKSTIASFMDNHSIDELSDIVEGKKVSGLNKTEEQVLYGALKRLAVETSNVNLVDKLVKSGIASERSMQAQALGASRIYNAIDDPIQTIIDIGKAAKEKIKKITGKAPEDVKAKLDDISAKTKEVETAIAKKTQGTDTIKSTESKLAEAVKETDDAVKKAKIGSLIKKLEREFMDAGVTGRDANTQAVLDVVKKHVPDITFNEVRDAQSGYGKYAGLSENQLRIMEATNNQERRALAKLDEIEAGNFPKKTGREAVPPTKEGKALLAKVREGMKRLKIKDIKSSEGKTPAEIKLAKIEASIKRLEREGAKLDQEIKVGGKVTEKEGVLQVERITKLKAINEEKRLIRNELRNYQKVVDESAQLEKAIDSRWKTILENQKKIDEGNLARKAGRVVDEPYLKSLDNINKDLNKQLTKMRNDLKTKKTAQEIAEKRLESRLAKEIKSLDDQIEAATRLNKAQNKYDYSNKIKGLQEQKAAKKKEYDEFFKEELTREAVEKDIKEVQKAIQKLQAKIDVGNFDVEVRGVKERAPEVQELLKEKKRLQDIIKEKRLELDPNAKYRARLEKEAKNIQEQLDVIKEGDKGALESMRAKFAEKKPKKVLDAETERLLKVRDDLKKDYETIMKSSGVPAKEEIETLLHLSKQKSSLLEKFDTKTGKWANEADRAAYGYAANDYLKFVELLKSGTFSIKELAERRIGEFKTTWKGTDKVAGSGANAVTDVMKDLFTEISLASKAMVGSWDNSFIGRQGRHVLLTHPTAWWPGAVKSFKVLMQSLIDKNGADKAMRAIRANIMSDPLYLDGTFQKAGIVDFVEEEFMSNYPHRIPGLGKVFKASEAAFVGTGEMMRTAAFKIMYDNALKATGPLTGAAKDALIKDFGEIAGSLTGRSTAKIPTVITPILWAPKMIAANINTLTAHGLGTKLAFGRQIESSAARKEAIANLAKISGTYIGLAVLINEMRPGTVELDPRSSEFLKGRFANTRIDLTQGVGQYATWVARAAFALTGAGEGAVKSANTKILHGINTGNKQDPTLENLATQFIANKAAPFPRAIIDTIFRGRTFEGEKPTLAGITASMFTPIPAQNAYKNLYGDYPITNNLWESSWEVKVAATATALELLGVSANTYIPAEVYSEKETKEMKELISKIGKGRVKLLEIEYNKRINKQIDNTVNRSWYKRLDNEDKKDVIRKLKAKTKKAVFGL